MRYQRTRWEGVSEDFYQGVRPGQPSKAQDPQASGNVQTSIIKIKKQMANHKSSLKRIRQTKTRNEHNRYYAKTMRNAVRKLRATTDKEEAVKMYPAVQKMLDKLAKTNIIHKNKAANLKSSLCLHIKKLG
jgi:small subunit ribosomal protein S20